jgi:DNA invertase Pin-like site-specific DNA recombinase
MSTEHQQYSTSNQMDVIKDYAQRRGMTIVKTYSDEGKSGLNIQGRDSLAQMIEDVEKGEAGFSSILVYDVSRWGRFQDADESAYYEFRHAEAIPNDCKKLRWAVGGFYAVGRRLVDSERFEKNGIAGSVCALQ